MIKKIITTAVILSASLLVKAQGTSYNMFQDRNRADQILRASIAIIVLSGIGIFIVTIIRAILDYRLKNKMIEKGVSENLAFQFLHTTKRNEKTSIIKWFCLLCGIGTGLLLVGFIAPYGIHSLAIILFCIAAALLGFFLYLKQTGEQ